MGYQLRMSSEIHGLAAEPAPADPPRARLVAEALAALAAAGASLGPPLVRPADPDQPGAGRGRPIPGPSSTRPTRTSWSELAALRRRVADAATLARQFSRQIGDLGALRLRLAEQRQEAQAAGDDQPGRGGAAGHRRRGRPAGHAARAAAPGDVGRAGPGPAELPAAGAHRGAADQEGDAQGAVHGRRGRGAWWPGPPRRWMPTWAASQPRIRPTAQPDSAAATAADQAASGRRRDRAELRRAGHRPAQPGYPPCWSCGPRLPPGRPGRRGRDQHPVRRRAAGYRAADRRARWWRRDPGAPRRRGRCGPGGAAAGPAGPGSGAGRAQLPGRGVGAGRVRSAAARRQPDAPASCGSCRAAP